MKLSIRSKLLGAFALDLLLMLFLGFLALTWMQGMNDKATFIADRVFPSLSNVSEINRLLASYRTHQLEYILNANRADKSRIEKSMKALEGKMQIHLNKHLTLVSPEADRVAFDRVRQAWANFVTTNHEEFLPATRFANTGTVQPAFTRLNPLFDELTAAARALAAHSEQAAATALGEVHRDYHRSQAFITLDTMVSLILSAAVGLALAATIGQRVRRLTRATISVAEGDLERHVEATGGDEIEVLAKNFNVMVKSLRAERGVLELRHRELRESLDLQRRLTEDLIFREQAEREARQARAEAEAASQAKSFFLATMSHELRTPLNAILGYAQILYLESARRGESQFLPELERIQTAGKHLLTLISNVLDFSKIEQGKMDLEILEFDIGKLLDDVVNISEPLANENGNRLILDDAPRIGTMRSDPGKVRQILFNLLSNAAKHTRKGTITLRVRRQPPVFDTDADRLDGAGTLRLDVEDTGHGIPPEELAKLFQPFSQAQSPQGGSAGGTGLGLVVSRQLCHMLGGEISVASEVGSGSIFSVDLPLTAPELSAKRQRDTEGSPILRSHHGSSQAHTVLLGPAPHPEESTPTIRHP